MIEDLIMAKKYISKANRASKKGLDFTLTFAQYKRLMSRKTCAYSGLRFSEINEKRAWKNEWLGLTLDRIDNSKGYIQGNVVPVCNGVNQLKGQWENPLLPFDEKTTIKIITKIMLAKNNLDILD